MKHRKYYIAFIALISIFTILTICKIKDKNKIKIVLFNENTKLLEKSILEFGKKNNIEIEIEKQDFYATMSMLEKKEKFGEKFPDIFMTASDWLGEIVNKDIAEKVESKSLEGIIPSIKEGVTVNGKYYGYPYRIETVFLYCNKDKIKKIPQSVEEMLFEKNRIEKNGGKHGVVFPTDEIYYHYQWYKYFGGNVNGIMELKQNDIVMKNEIDFIERNFEYLNGNGAMKKYNSEESSMMINGSWEIEKIKKNKFKTEYGMIKEESFKPFIGVKSFVIYKKSNNKKNACKLLKYLMEEEQQKKFAEEEWHITPNKKVFYNGKNRAAKELEWCIESPEMMPSNLSIRNNCNKAGELFSRVVKNREDIEKSIIEVFGGEM